MAFIALCAYRLSEVGGSWFVTLPPLYKILPIVFFVVRLVVIRKKYYRIIMYKKHYFAVQNILVLLPFKNG